MRGERRGALAAIARGALRLASLVFGLVVALRAALFRLGLLRVHAAPVAVLSIGNLTVGGTGKTPLVVHVARALAARGERVAVVARGYGAAPGELNDELRLVADEAPGTLVVADRDRVRGAREAAARGATVVLLDDGFQHRRLRRDLDVVVLDATDPWGPAGLLPRGLLREPRGALRRAGLVVLSRAEQADDPALARLEAEVRATGYAGAVARLRLVPRALRALGAAGAEPGGAGRAEAVEALAGEPVLAACGIGNPRAFERTLLGLSARVRELVALPDHAPFGPAEVARIEAAAARAGARRVVVTAKDAVKLRDALGAAPRAVPWWALDVEVRLDPGGALDTMCGVARASCPPRAVRPGGPES